MKRKRYSSDLREQDWQLISPLIVTSRASKWPLEEVINGIFYQLKNSCPWYDLPGDLPPWQSVLYHFKKWSADGTWQKVNSCLLRYYGKQMPPQKNKQGVVSKAVFDLSWMKHRAIGSEA